MKPKYIAYVRKSTEGLERQALSIETQRRKIREFFPDLKIIDYVEERRSAYEPNNRPSFDSVLDRITAGEAQGIVAWHPDRLSRNEEEAAKITYRVRTGKIADLKFCSYNFDNSPEGIMMLQLALSQSQYSSSKLSKDVKRGLEQKLRLGQRPGVVPEGYLNDKANKDVIIDPERFDLVRKMWDMMLTGQYTPPKIADIANKEWGYRTVQRSKIGGKPLSRSSSYYMFTNMYYAGIIVHKGEQYPGSHTAMITLEEYDHVQQLLGRKGKPRKTAKREFAFTGFIKCGECGCSYTAEVSKGHTYYHCTRRKKDVVCSQRKNIREEVLDGMLESELAKYTIQPDFRDWALEALRESNLIEAESRNKIYETQQRALVNAQKQMDSLIDMRTRDLLNDEEYTERRDSLRTQINRLKEETGATEERAEKWLELTERTFNFATYAHKAFLFGDLAAKKEIVMALGQNFEIKDRLLQFEANKWLQPIAEDYPAMASEYEKVRTADDTSGKAKTAAIAGIRSNWLGW